MNFKAQAHMRELKQRLQLSFASASFSEAMDANGNPEMKMTVGSEIQFIKIQDVGNAGRVDALGLAQRAYSPHKVQILRDAAASDQAARDKLMAACSKLGMKLEMWEDATMPASFDISGATKLYEIKSDEINPLIQSQ